MFFFKYSVNNFSATFQVLQQPHFLKIQLDFFYSLPRILIKILHTYVCELAACSNTSAWGRVRAESVGVWCANINIIFLKRRICVSGEVVILNDRYQRLMDLTIQLRFMQANYIEKKNTKVQFQAVKVVT